MEKEQLGTVISTMEGPSPSKMSFVVNNGKVHTGMFVELEYSEGTMVCRVEDVLKTNRYFERPDSVKAIGPELEKNFPAAEWEFLLAHTKPLGVFKENLINRTTFPPSPGTKVFVAENEHIKKFLGIEEKGLNLGELQFHDVGMKVNLSRLLQKHLAILAMSGAGKSYAVSVLLEELLDRTKEQGQIAVIAFDTHGEYTCFGEPVAKANSEKYKDYSSKTKIIDGTKVRIAVSNITFAMLKNISPGLTPTQSRALLKIISRLKSEMRSGVGPFDLSDVKGELDALDPKLAEGVSSAIDEIEETGLFGRIDAPSVFDLAKSGQFTVVDLSKIITDKKRQVIVGHFAHRLFSERRHQKVPPFSLLVEEAHNFIPEGISSEEAPARGTLRTIAREGRKFCASLILISQRPKRLDTTTLANCNTNIILRITNPYDLKHIQDSCEGLDNSSAGTISSLRVGEALIIGEAVGAPTFFKVRQRKSQPSRHETTLEEAAKKFSENADKGASEADAFL
ncbi:MAG: ATP-binding protein [archaeon]